MTPTVSPATVPTSTRRTLLLRLSVGLSALVAALYLVVFFVQLPHIREGDNPAPAYAALALVYAAVAAGLALRDTPAVQWIGAAIQVIVLVLFFWLLALLYREGDQQFILDMLGLAIVITALQFVLLGLLAYVAMIPRSDEPT